MPDAVIHLRFSSREEVRGIIYNAYRSIAGEEPDTYGFADKFWSAVAHSLFTSIWDAFLQKSKGGIDELGSFWKDLEPETKAYSRPDARKGLSLPGPKSRPTLTAQQDKAWRARFYHLWKHLAVQMGEAEAKKIASAAAWNFVKDQYGATTILEQTRNLVLPILNRTGNLQQSLFPAPLVDGSYRPLDDEQVFRIQSGSLTLGTEVPYASRVDQTRPLWPDSIGPWLDRAVAAGRDAVFEHIQRVLQSA